MDYEGLRGQSAIEYLMTYGWMLLVVAIVGGAIFSVVQSQNLYSSSGFVGGDITIENFGTTKNENLQVELRNTAQDSINIKKLVIDDGEQKTQWRSGPDISVGDSEVWEVLNVQQSSSENNNLDVKIQYDVGNLKNLETSGTISGPIKVTEDSGASDTWFTADANYRRTGFVLDDAPTSQPSIVWNFTSSNNIDYQDPTHRDGLTVISDNGGSFGDGNVYGVDSEGNQVWEENIDASVWGSATIGENYVYQGDWNPNNGPTIYSIDKSSGDRIWKSGNSGQRVWDAPIVLEDRIYITDNTFGLIELEKDSGQINWQVETGGQGLGDEAYVYGVLYAAGGENFVAIDTETQDILWNVSHTDFYPDGGYEDKASRSRPAIADGRVFMGSENSTWAMDASNGDLIWQKELQNWVRGGVSYYNNTVYVADKNSAYALDYDTGNELWRYDAKDQFSMANIAVNQDGAYFADNSGEVYGVDHSGNEIWTFNATEDSILSGPSINNDGLYVATSGNDLLRLE